MSRAIAPPAPSLARLLAGRRPLLLAHRGDSSRAPENTWPAFESALQIPVELIELDYQQSADGVPIVIHDATLDRTTDAAEQLGRPGLRVAELPAAQLVRLDAGAWREPEFAGTRLSPLAEVLARLTSRVCVMVERKSGDAATLIALLRGLDCVDKVTVQAFDWGFLRDCRALAPELCLGALGEGPLTAATVQEIRGFGARIVGWNQRDLTAAAIEAVRAAGLHPWSWTIDDPDRARELLSWGLEGLTTNRPAELRALVPH